MYKFIIRQRSALLVWLTHRMALPVLKLIRKPELFPYTINALEQFGNGTLGKDLANFLEEKDLELLPYYARHDIKHILLQYDITDEGEGSLQCFMLGNGHVSFPVLATVLYCFCTMPEHWRKFVNAYKRGQRVIAISNWPWFEVLKQQTSELQSRII